MRRGLEEGIPLRRRLSHAEAAEQKKLQNAIDKFYADNANDLETPYLHLPPKIQEMAKRLKWLEDVGGYTKRREVEVNRHEAARQEIYAEAESRLSLSGPAAANQWLEENGLPAAY